MSEVREWLDSREAGVPPALVTQLRASTSAHSADPVFDALIGSATEVLGRVLAADPITRAQALDLLTADALATHAFDAAADDPSTLRARADAAMHTFADLARRPE